MPFLEIIYKIKELHLDFKILILVEWDFLEENLVVFKMVSLQVIILGHLWDLKEKKL